MLKFKSRLLILSQALWLTACGGKLDPVNKHEDGVAPAQVQAADSHPQASAELKDVEALLQNPNSPAFLDNAKKFYLNRSFWQNALIYHSDVFVKFMDLTHSRLVDIPVEKRWPELSGHFDSLCQDDLKGCDALLVLRSSPKSAGLLAQAAALEKDTQKKYKLFLMSFDIQNQNFPHAALEAFLTDVKSYRESLVADKNQDLLGRLDRVLSLLLNLYQEGKLKTQDISWIQNLPLLQSLNPEDISIAGSSAVTQKDGKSQLSAELSKEIEKNQNLSDSFSKRMRWLDEKNPKLKSQLKIQTMEKNASFFLIDQLYTGRWSPKQADAFFKSAKLQTSQVFAVAKNYTNSQMAYIISLSQSELSQFLKKSRNLDATNLFSEGKKALIQSSTEARALAERLLHISQFFSLSATGSDEDREFSKILNSMEKTLKVSVSYPATLILFDTGIRLGISANTILEIQKFDAEGRMPFEAYVQQVFRGEIMPLLDYTSDTEPLSAFEVGEAIEMTVQSGWYASQNRSPDEALTDLFELYMQSNAMSIYRGSTPPQQVPTKLSILRDSMENLEAKFNHAEWQDTVHLCKGLQTGKSLATQTFEILQVIESPTLGSLAERLADTYDGNSGVSGGSGNSTYNLKKLGYFMVNRKTVSQMEWLRLDLLPTIQYFTSLKQALEKTGVALPKLGQHLDSVRGLAISFLKKMKARFLEANDCWYFLMKRERQMMAQLVQYENSYWTWAHGEIQAGREISSLFSSDLPKGLAYRTTASPQQGVTLYSFDLLLRIRAYLKYGIPVLKLPPLSPGLNIVVSDSLLKNTLYKDAGVVSVPVSAQKKIFAQAAVQASGFVGNQGVVQWYLPSYFAIYNFQSYFDAIALFYRISPLLEQVLGMQKYYSADELLQLPLQARSFLSLTDLERSSQALIGISSRYQDMDLRMGGQFLQDNGQATPSYDYILKSLVGRWMADFGDPDLWEKAEIKVARPAALIPFSKLAENIYRYQKETHLFSSGLNSRGVFLQSFKPVIQKDLQLAADFAKLVESRNPTLDVMFNNTDKLHVEAYSPAILKNVESNITRTHQLTGGIFRP